MKNYLQLLLLGLVISLLSLYLAGMSVFGSVDAPIIEKPENQVHQPVSIKALSQELVQRKEPFIREYQQKFKYAMREQKQKIQDNMRGLKEKWQNLGHN